MRKMSLEDVHEVLYDILVDIHEFCVENNIMYSLGGGTLLGAIRHNGFIPWDDDIDIQFSRPEFERFIHSYHSKRGYRLFSRELPGCEDVGVAFARVCEMERTYVDTGLSPWQRCPTGLWIDIMPIDGAPSDETVARKRIKKMTLYWRLAVLARARFSIPFSSAKSLKMRIRLIEKTDYANKDRAGRWTVSSAEEGDTRGAPLSFRAQSRNLIDTRGAGRAGAPIWSG